MPTQDALQAKIDQAEKSLRLVWVIAFGAIVFSMLTVTPLVQRVTPDEWDKTAMLLPLVVDAAVIIVVRMDATISGFNAKSGAWPNILRWMTGLFTLGLNIGDSALKGSLVGVGVHAVCPLLLIATSEAIPRYRRTIGTAVAEIRREQAAERDRREQQRTEREREQRAEREQAAARREQSERERLEQAEREARERREQAQQEAREQREHEARVAQEEREHAANLERERLDREAAERAAEQERATRIRLAEIAATERQEQADREERERERERLEKAEAVRRAEAQARREQQQRGVREHPAGPAPAVREQRPLRAVNTQTPDSANTPKVPESVAMNIVRDAVNNGDVQVRKIARETGWSPAWVSARVNKLRDDGEPEEGEGDEQASA